MGREKLAFLNIHAAFGPGRGLDQIGLAAQKCGNLEDIADFGNGPALGDFVNVGQHWDPEGAFDFGERGQAAFQAGAAEAGAGGAVGFVKTGFENKRQAEIGANAGEFFGRTERQSFVFDDAWPGDHEQRGTGAAEF